MDTVIILKSLADETRLSVVRELAQRDHEVASRDILADCSRALNLSQPTMSHHFALLVRAGVLGERKSGTEKFYRLNHDTLRTHGIDPSKL